MKITFISLYNNNLSIEKALKELQSSIVRAKVRSK